uniref:Uncharacterized protein n=1 Tax=Hucho hucho TaxID=62062 RepID=A0A4W5LNR8_9TELE
MQKLSSSAQSPQLLWKIRLALFKSPQSLKQPRQRRRLSQILQEKDQLQREQEDRIKNLTKLLVTSSNFVSIKKRVTWGGKLASPAFHHAGESDLSFAEPFLKKRKADMSVLTEQNEDGNELDSTFDMEMNQSSVSVVLQKVNFYL